MNYLRITLVTIALTVLSIPQIASGQPHFGFRGGITLDPEQIHFGVHMQADVSTDARFQPNFEIGFGDNLTVIALNPELVYLFKPQGSVIPYAGGGPSINIIQLSGPSVGSATEVGVNLAGGIDVPLQSGRVVMIELRIGIGDIPEVKLTGGITF